MLDKIKQAVDERTTLQKVVLSLYNSCLDEEIKKINKIVGAGVEPRASMYIDAHNGNSRAAATMSLLNTDYANLLNEKVILKRKYHHLMKTRYYRQPRMIELNQQLYECRIALLDVQARIDAVLVKL